MQEFKDNSQPPAANQPEVNQPVFNQAEVNQPPFNQPIVNQPPQKPKPGKTSWIWYVAGGVVLLGIVACLIYFAGLGTNQSDNNSNAQAPAATPAQSTTPAAPATPASSPAVPSTPAITPATPVATPPVQTPSQPNIQTPSSSIDLSKVITKQAYTLVLTLDDMGVGWTQASAAARPKGTIYSSSHVNFTRGTSFSPVVQNIVSVYRTIDAAKAAYESEIPTTAAGASLSHPAIGDECFLNDAVTINKLLVFRKNNIVVWVMVQQDKTGDPIQYAQIVAQKIIQ